MLQAFGGMSVDDYCAASHEFLTHGAASDAQAHLPRLRLQADGRAPSLSRSATASQLHRLCRRPRFHAHRDSDIYGIPPERIVGSSNALQYVDGPDGGAIVYLAKPDVFDDGPVKPVRIWSRIGRRPILAFGNSNGDIPMLKFTGGKGRPALRLLLLHDDKAREFDYVAGAEKSLELAKSEGWTVVSVKNDWKTVFA